MRLPAGLFLRRLRGRVLPALPASGGSRHPWLVAASLCSLPPSSRGRAPCVCVFLLLPLARTLVIGLRAHPGNPGRFHLQVLQWVCKDPFSELGHIHRFQGLGRGCVLESVPSCSPTDPKDCRQKEKSSDGHRGREIPLSPLQLQSDWVPAIEYNCAPTLHTLIEHLLCCHTPWGR